MIGSPGSPISEFVQFVDANISVFMDLPIQLLATEEETNTVPTENSTPTKESPTAPETFKKNTRWTPEEAVDNLFSKLGTYKSNSRKILLKFCSSGLKEDAELRLRARRVRMNFVGYAIGRFFGNDCNQFFTDLRTNPSALGASFRDYVSKQNQKS